MGLAEKVVNKDRFGLCISKVTCEMTRKPNKLLSALQCKHGNSMVPGSVVVDNRYNGHRAHLAVGTGLLAKLKLNPDWIKYSPALVFIAVFYRLLWFLPGKRVIKKLRTGMLLSGISSYPKIKFSEQRNMPKTIQKTLFIL